jgi:hypothetical protein
MSWKDCSVGSDLYWKMENAMLERVRAEGALMDLNPPVEERDRRFKKSEEA